MDRGQCPGVLVSEATASPQRQSEGEPDHCQPTGQRKVFYLLSFSNIGGTEVQALALATRLNSEPYDVTLGCLGRTGPRLERCQGFPVSVRQFCPDGASTRSTGVSWCFGWRRSLDEAGVTAAGKRFGRTGKAMVQVLRDPGLGAEAGKNVRADGSAELNFQREIDKTDPMYTELLHSGGAE